MMRRTGITAKPTPPGFSISFDRHHGRRWGWRQKKESDAPPYDSKRFGFRNRKAAYEDLIAEIKKREQDRVSLRAQTA